MPRSYNQKLKLLYIQKFLLENSDEEHPVTIARLIEALASNGISAERKSIYTDIEALRSFGLDIEAVRGRGSSYYIASREFEVAELKLLVDAVQSSKFITVKKSQQLIAKIESLASIHEAKLLERQVFVTNRIKTMNESIYYNVDKIHSSIECGQKISFKYFEYAVDKTKKYKRGGGEYLISPLALTWDDENYYMLGFDSTAKIIKHYRVDKMDKIESLEVPREGVELFEKLDMAQYSKKVFSMFGGREERVKLALDNSLIGVILDRFGKDVLILRMDDSHFIVSVTVEISPQFFGWLVSFGKNAEILEPEELRNEYITYMQEILDSF